MEPIKLSDGTEWIPLEKEAKDALELEIKAVLEKYNASYLPIIREEKSITHTLQKAVLLLLKKKESGIKSVDPEVNPLINGEPNNTTEDSKEAK